MICSKCIDIFKKEYIGKKTTDGSMTKDIKGEKKGTINFSGYSPYFNIYVQTEKTFKNGKVKEKEIEMGFKAKFCAFCGEKQQVKKDEL